MSTGTVFLTNRSQAVRLPKSVAFPEGVAKVAVQVVGNTRVLTPIASTWSEWAAHRQARDPEFLDDRAQGAFDQRNWGA